MRRAKDVQTVVSDGGPPEGLSLLADLIRARERHFPPVDAATGWPYQPRTTMITEHFATPANRRLADLQARFHRLRPYSAARRSAYQKYLEALGRAERKACG